MATYVNTTVGWLFCLRSSLPYSLTWYYIGTINNVSVLNMVFYGVSFTSGLLAELVDDVITRAWLTIKRSWVQDLVTVTLRFLHSLIRSTYRSNDVR